MLNLQGHYHEEVKTAASMNLKQKYYQGNDVEYLESIVENLFFD